MVASDILNFNVIDVFLIEVPMFPLSYVKIGQIVQQWQPCFETQDGGARHLEVRILSIFDNTDVF